jgi:hypothetical protein
MIIIFQGLLYAVIAACMGMIKMRFGFDIFGFYISFIPIGSLIIGTFISKIFYDMLKAREIQIRWIYCITSIFFVLISYYGMKYFVYYNTYIDSLMEINYVGIGNHISEFYNSDTGNSVTFHEYCFQLNRGSEMIGMIGGNGYSLNMPNMGALLEVLNPISLVVMVIIMFFTAKPSIMYCKKCNKYMNEKQVFIFNTGDNFANTMLEKIEQCTKDEEGVEILREVIRVNQELRGTSDEFVVGNYNYCDNCNQLYLVLIRYTINKQGVHKKHGIMKKYVLDEKFFRLIIR